MTDYDIAIVGAGLAGISVALALSQLPLRIAVIDSKTDLVPPPPGKALALSYGSHRYLHRLGLDLEAESKITSVQVSQKGSFGSLRLSAADAGVEALGYLYNEHTLLKALYTELERNKGVVLLHPTALTQIHLPTKTLSLTDRHITTTLLIGADSTHSTVAKLLNLTPDIQEDNQSALVCRLSLENPHGGIAFQRFTDAETFGVIPAGDRQYALIISGENSIVHSWKIKSKIEFLQTFYERFGYRLGKVSEISEPVCYPLARSQAPTALPTGVLLMGNAAHTIHPLAAQGWNLTLRDVACLGEILKNAVDARLALDDPSIGQAYQTARRQDQIHTAKFTHALSQIFHSQHPLLKISRTFGLIACDALSPLRTYLTQSGAGV